MGEGGGGYRKDTVISRAHDMAELGLTMSYLPHMRPSPAHQVPASGPCTGGEVVLTPNLHHVVVGALPGEYHCGACSRRVSNSCLLL